MDRLVKPDLQELSISFTRCQRCYATFKLTNLMHTMSVAVSLTTTNPSFFTCSQPLSIIPPLSTSTFTLFLSQPSDHPPLSSPLDTILVRSSMLPTGKAHQDDLHRLFSKPGPHIFKDATIPISLVGPHVVESLILSASPKSLEVAFLLSKAIFWCDKRQLTSLLWCSAKHGNAYFASALVEAGADVNSKDANGQSAMSSAIKSGNIGVVRVLIESGYTIDNSTDADLFLHDAAAMNCLDLMEILCSGYADIDLNSINPRGQTALHVAAINGHLEMVRFLVSVGSDPDILDFKGWSPLHYATQEGHVEAVGFLLDHSISAKYAITREGKTAFDLAVDEGYSDLYNMLHLGDVLHRAARIGDVEAIKKCLAEGAKVNSRDQNGWTPLHRAAFKGRIESLKVLIGHGALVDLVNDIGYTPLHLAVEAGHMQVALYLLAHGAKANLKSLKAENNINSKFILLEKGRATLEGQQKTCLVLVADETAAVHFQLWGQECDAFEAGDILSLCNGIFSYNRNNHLVLRAGKRGQVQKVGEFTMAFVETPNMSEIRWVPHPDNITSKTYVQDAIISSHSRIFPPMN